MQGVIMGRSSSYFPTSDTGLLAWSSRFSAGINASPEAFGLSPSQAADYAAIHASFATAMAACAPAMRNKTSVVAKNTARAALKAQARLLVSIIQGQPSVTDAEKTELGLTVRNPLRVPIPAPEESPTIQVEQVVVNRFTLRLLGSTNPGRRGKPSQVAGASIFYFAGEEAPTNLNDWAFATGTTRTRVEIVIPSSVAPGSKIWLTACWKNPRDMSGPLSHPISTYVQYGVRMAA
jgi:hypothetical protein